MMIQEPLLAVFTFLGLNFFFGMYGIGPYTIPITVIVVIIYYAVKRHIKSSTTEYWREKNRQRKTDHSERTYYQQSTTESPNSEYYQQHGTFNKTSQIDKDKLVRSRLERFHISEDEAEIVFGKAWRDKLGKEHWKLFYTTLEIQADLLYKKKYRKKVFHIIDKVIQIIDSVYNEDPKFAKEWESKSEKRFTGSYGFSYSFIEEWEFFKKHKKTKLEFELFGADISEAYKVLGLGITATIEQVRKRYRVLALKWHPDRNKVNKTQAEQMFVKITQAYETIMAVA